MTHSLIVSPPPLSMPSAPPIVSKEKLVQSSIRVSLAANIAERLHRLLYSSDRTAQPKNLRTVICRSILRIYFRSRERLPNGTVPISRCQAPAARYRIVCWFEHNMLCLMRVYLVSKQFIVSECLVDMLCLPAPTFEPCMGLSRQYDSTESRVR
jgi:hypothetical protein